MSTHVTASLPDDPALLRIEGPVATITLNRPAAFNSIDLSIAKKLEQLGAEVEASDEIRVLVIEGEGRAFCAGGDLQTIGAAAAADTIAPVVGELLQHYHAFIDDNAADAEDRAFQRARLGGRRGHGRSPSSPTSASPPTMPASRRPTPRSACRRTAAAPLAWSRSVGVRRALQIFLAEDSFSAQQAYDWGLVAKVVPAAELKGDHAKVGRNGWRKTAGRYRWHQSIGLSGGRHLDRQQLDAEAEKIIDAMRTDEFRVAVKKFTNKGK